MRLTELYKQTELKPIDWESIGLKDTGGDACLWIGSVGSQTKLHRDAYGWNCVCQLYGRKLWRLAPPEAEIPATRLRNRDSNLEFF